MILHSRARFNSGLTLVEMLVSIVCFAIILLAFTSLFSNLTKIWMAGSSDIDLRQNVAVAAARLGAEVRSALPPYDSGAHVNFIGIDSTTAGTKLTNSVDDELKFHDAGWSASEGQSPNYGVESQRMYYWLRNNGGTDVRIQMDKGVSKQDDTIPLIGTVVSTGNEPLAYNISQLNIEYMRSNGTWTNDWNARTSKGLPELVRITMKAAKGTRSKQHTFIARPGARAARLTL